MSIQRMSKAAFSILKAYRPANISEALEETIKETYSKEVFGRHLSWLADNLFKKLSAEISDYRYGSQFYIYESIDYNYFRNWTVIVELRDLASMAPFWDPTVTAARLVLIKNDFESRFQRIVELSLIGDFQFEDPADQFEAELGINWRPSRGLMAVSELEDQIRFIRTSLDYFGTFRAGAKQPNYVTGLSNVEPFITIGGTVAAIGGFLGLIKLVQDNIEKFYRIKKVMLEAEAAGIQIDTAKEAANQARIETARKVVELLAEKQAAPIEPEVQGRLQNIAEGVLDRLVSGMRIGMSTADEQKDFATEFEAIGLTAERLSELRRSSPIEMPPIEAPRKLLGGPESAD